MLLEKMKGFCSCSALIDEIPVSSDQSAFFHALAVAPGCSPPLAL